MSSFSTEEAILKEFKENPKAFTGRDLMLLHNDRKLRGPIHVVEPARDKQRQLMGLVVRPHWTVENTGKEGAWCHRTSYPSRDIVIGVGELNSVKCEKDGETIHLAFSDGKIIRILPPGENFNLQDAERRSY